MALKLLHPKYRAIHSVRERLRREASVLESFEHPNIAACVAVALDVDRPYIAMELVEGVGLERELGARARANSPFGLFEVGEIFAQLCSAVAHAHARGIVHRDLKPHNVIFVRGPKGAMIKVLDFGVAKLLHQEASRETTQGRMLGTLMYMAPEQAAGARVDHRADVFALGVILHELLSLKRAWALSKSGGALPTYVEPLSLDGLNAPLQVIQRLRGGTRPRPSMWRPDVQKEMDEVVARALHPDPERRFPTTEALASAVRALLVVGGEDRELTVIGAEGSADPAFSEEDADLVQARLLSVEAGHDLLSVTQTGIAGGLGELEVRPARLGLRPSFVLGFMMFILLSGLVVHWLDRPREPTLARAIELPKPPVRAVAGASAPVEVAPPAERPPAEAPPKVKAPPPNVRGPRARSPATELESLGRANEEDERRFSALDGDLRRLRVDPSNVELFGRLVQSIQRAADEHVSLAPERDRIKRLAGSSALGADLAQLERAFEELRRHAD